MRHVLFWLQRFRHGPLLGLIVLMSILFLLEPLFPWSIAERLSMIPADVTSAFTNLPEDGLDGHALVAFGRTLTAAMVHGGPDHIVYNMVFLWMFGFLASQLLGRYWAFGFFFLFAIVGNLVQVLLEPTSPIPVLGASGAVLGFEGLYLGLAMTWDLRWPEVWPLARPIPPLQLATFAIFGVAFDFYSLMNHAQGVAFGAHLGGFFCGLLTARLITLAYPNDVAFRMAQLRKDR
jgi:membrane associated rhomboid family serine protease